MNRTAKAHTPRWTSFPLTGTRSSDKSHSLLDAVVGFNKNAEQFSPVADWMGSIDLFPGG